MRRRDTVLLFFPVLASILLFPDCALINRESAQVIPVTSSPVGATISVNGQPRGVTPSVIRLARKLKGQVIRIEAAGYDPYEIRVKRAASTGSIISDIGLGALFGAMVSLLVAVITDEGLWSTDPGPFASDTALLIAVPVGMIGFPILDLAIGNAYDLKPRELIVTLKKADGTPRIDTVFVEADELRSIKWIRVRRD